MDKQEMLRKNTLVTSKSFLGFTSIHWEPLILALFNRLRALQFGLLNPFSNSELAVSKLLGCSALGELWIPVATAAAVRPSNSPFWSAVSSLGTLTRSLQKQ